MWVLGLQSTANTDKVFSCIGTYCYQLIQYINSAFPCVVHYMCTFAHLIMQEAQLIALNWPASDIHCMYTETQGFSYFELKKGEMGDVACRKLGISSGNARKLRPFFHVTCFNTYQCNAARARILRFTCHIDTFSGKLVCNWTCHWTQYENFPKLSLYFWGAHHI